MSKKNMKEQGEADYIDEILEGDSADSGAFGIGNGGEKDSEYDKAVACVLETGQASVSMLQRRLGWGYPKAARIMDQMEENGIVSAMKTNGKRDILVPRN